MTDHVQRPASRDEPCSSRAGSRARRYCVQLIAGTLGGLAMIAGINVAVDVSGLYWLHRLGEGTPPVTRYVAAMVSSSNGVMATSYERLIKLELAHQSQADRAIIGSSHEMSVRQNLAGGIADRCRALVNLGVSGASFEDVLTLLHATVESGRAKIVFVGIGPWMFRRNADDRWEEYTSAFHRSREAFGLPLGKYPEARKISIRLANLINSDYAWANLKSVMAAGPVAAHLPVKTVRPDRSNLLPNDSVFEPDGSLTYSSQYIGEKQKFGDGSYKLGLPLFDPTVGLELKSALTAARNRGIVPVLVMMPYSPGVFECRNAAVCDALSAIERSVREIGRELGLKVVGGYDPRPFGLVQGNFYDEAHLKPEGIAVFGRAPVETPLPPVETK